MQRALLATLAALTLAACSDPTASPSGMTLQLDGRVTAASDDSPIPNATVQLRHWDGVCTSAPCPTQTDVTVTTDAEGRYTLAFVTDQFCSAAYHLLITAPGYADWWSTDWADIRCTEQAQTIDAALAPATT